LLLTTVQVVNLVGHCTLWMFNQDAETVDDMDKATSRVQRIAAELLETERKYVQKLHLIDQVLS